jgi:large subunit ribosomal protein L20
MRIKGGVRTKHSHKKILDLAKGYRMTRRKQIGVATQAVLHAGEYAFMGRKLRKRNFRQLWITRINAGLHEMGANYSTFINTLKTQNILLDRKILAYFASEKPEIFKKIVETVNK